MIIDASVAIKWLVPETGSDLARRLILKGDLIAPDLIAAEIANAIWKKQRKGEISGIPPSLGVILGSLDMLVEISPLIERATQIAVELDHPAYDCFYLALAEQTGRKFVTVDTRLANKLSGTSFAKLLISLEEAAA